MVIVASVRRVGSHLEARLTAIDYSVHPSRDYELAHCVRECPKGTPLRLAADAALVALQEALWAKVQVVNLAGGPSD